MQLFVDSDGVFASFDDNVRNFFGKYPRDFANDADMWAAINGQPRFWPDMPMMPGAIELWEAIKHANPIVLTGCPKSNYEHAAEHKLQWWMNGHFSHSRVITCLSKDKALHMEKPGDWLVDDMSKNIKRWEKAGGRGYRYDGDWQRCVAFLTKHGVL